MTHPTQIDPTDDDNGWVIRVQALDDPVLARAVGHWLAERFGASFEYGKSGLSVRVSQKEPVAGALEWLVDQIGRGRAGFDALGFASTHLQAEETRGGLEVLAGLSAEEAPERGEEPELREPDPKPPSDSPSPRAKRRLEPIGGGPARRDPVAALGDESAAVEPPSQGGEEQPGHRRPALEATGTNAPPLPDPPAGLPRPSAPGEYQLSLVDAGPDPDRTAKLLAAALGITKQEAAELTSGAPVVVAPRATARTVRRVDTVVRAAGRATFAVEKLP